MQWWLIKEKMLLSSLKKMRYKHLMRVVNLCRGGVSQLNGGGYNSKDG
jgi:HD superfamily phosphohydrolase YqeK